MRFISSREVRSCQKAKTFYFCVERSDITREYYAIESDEEDIEDIGLDADPTYSHWKYGEELDRWAMTKEEFEELMP